MSLGGRRLVHCSHDRGIRVGQANAARRSTLLAANVIDDGRGRQRGCRVAARGTGVVLVLVLVLVIVLVFVLKYLLAFVLVFAFVFVFVCGCGCDSVLRCSL